MVLLLSIITHLVALVFNERTQANMALPRKDMVTRCPYG